jgi:hypothetical protein
LLGRSAQAFIVVVFCPLTNSSRQTSDRERTIYVSESLQASLSAHAEMRRGRRMPLRPHICTYIANPSHKRNRRDRSRDELSKCHCSGPISCWHRPGNYIQPDHSKAEARPGDVKWQFVSTTNDYERCLLCPSTGEPVAVSQRQR